MVQSIIHPALFYLPTYGTAYAVLLLLPIVVCCFLVVFFFLAPCEFSNFFLYLSSTTCLQSLCLSPCTLFVFLSAQWQSIDFSFLSHLEPPAVNW